ncbi:5'-nucleotidase [Terasakiella sp. A23]|uniref:5'-nucleotidase n=1 Tax=Terasakiella sp. FCG-A23 TaxID=3080561 RepID=UPI0029553DE8|nr:5'-nucleotidase [Terasakiella sp. A23]MDV7341838.1 5'-nucleotidase [Terasakiella sp. A23]
MPVSLENILVVGIASSALFDLAESDRIFRNEGVEAYQKYQEENIDKPFEPGVAFPFIKNLLSLNEGLSDPLVEVILLSRNDAKTGLRAFRTINRNNLNITRAAFLEGGKPHRYIEPFECDLFLSANDDDVRNAIEAGHSAGCVIAGEGSPLNDGVENELRIAFDFDGVLADDESENVYVMEGLDGFMAHEAENVDTPHNPGPLIPFIQAIGRLQAAEKELLKDKEESPSRVRVSIVTARGAPSHERVLTTLEKFGITVNESFFLGGVEKSKILAELKPHIFFDDQITHLKTSKSVAPSVHVPFGVKNSG